MSKSYARVDEATARAIISRDGLLAHGSAIMGGVFYYRPGSPTGYPYVQVAEIKSGYEPDYWEARRDLLA